MILTTQKQLAILGRRIDRDGQKEQFADLSDFPSLADAIRQFAASYDLIDIWERGVGVTLFSACDESCFGAPANSWRVDKDEIGAGNFLPKKSPAR